MGITVHKGFFASRDDALRDILAEGTWPATALSPEHEGLPIHSHKTTLNVYVIEGTTDIFDEDSGETFDIEPGDKLVIPAGSRHAEGRVPTKMVYVLGLGDCLMLEDAIELIECDERIG